ncbi:hypothetical protein EYF80_007994 [Liparis tanakae]|uniref:Uncharacterized protein n=1 Tax=Liparis tanakae TaxID=230148 RepID=A0A4Z2IV92_9TELE|nr:hypothetical protein EYF80_007994 [Liparis tanakae]
MDVCDSKRGPDSERCCALGGLHHGVSHPELNAIQHNPRRDRVPKHRVSLIEKCLFILREIQTAVAILEMQRIDCWTSVASVGAGPLGSPSNRSKLECTCSSSKISHLQRISSE